MHITGPSEQLSLNTACRQAFSEEAFHSKKESDNGNGHNRRGSHDHMRAWTGIVEDRIDLDRHSEHGRVVEKDKRIQEFIPRDHKSVDAHGDEGRNG